MCYDQKGNKFFYKKKACLQKMFLGPTVINTGLFCNSYFYTKITATSLPLQPGHMKGRSSGYFVSRPES